MVLRTITGVETHRRQLKTILNHVQKYKSFVYEEARLVDDGDQQRIEVTIRARKNAQALCGACRRPGPRYGRLEPRRYEFVPLWGIAVFFVYARRRVNCPDCGVKAEWVPWAEGKETLIKTYQWFLARWAGTAGLFRTFPPRKQVLEAEEAIRTTPRWARRLSWREVAEAFGSNWDHVFRSVRYAVQWGLVHRDESGVEAIGVDEVAWRKGHTYLTLVYQIDQGMKRLLWVSRDRTERSLSRFFDLYGETILPTLSFVCSDMWQPYLNVIAQRAGDAVHILDRFHIMKKMNEAIDQVRREEVRCLKADAYEPILKHSRWALLKNAVNWTHKETVKMRELLQYNLRSVRARLMREDFQRFWEYRSAGWAEKFLHEWCTRAMRSRLEPMKKVARSLRNHQTELLNWFRAGGADRNHRQVLPPARERPPGEIVNRSDTNALTESNDEFSSGIADKNRKEEPGGPLHRAPATVSVGPGSPWQVALQQRLRPFHRAGNCHPHPATRTNNLKTGQTRPPGPGTANQSTPP